MEINTNGIERHSAFPLCLCAGERLKLIGTTDGRFPDFGHHSEKEMGGLWLHPVKLLDGFWFRFKDFDSENVDVWTIADSCEVRPEGVIFNYGSNLGHTPVRIVRSQIIPEAEPGLPGSGAGLIVTFSLSNSSADSRKVETEFLARTDLRPVWYSEKAGIFDAQDSGEWFLGESLFLAKDGGHEWYAALGSLPVPGEVSSGEKRGPENTCGQGVSVSFIHTFEIAGGETKELSFYIAGSHASREDCVAAYKTLFNRRNVWEEKRRRTERLLGQSKLTVEDKRFQAIYDWVKINTDWLVIDAAPYGRALGAGIPEYPWWFGCDNCYALQGVLAAGNFALVKDTLSLLLDYSEKHNGNGRILHEINTFGIAAHPGNTQETAHLIIMAWLYFEWTGDRDFLEKYFPLLEKSAAWLRGTASGDLFPKGYGIIEIAGLNSKMLDTAVYAAAAYSSFEKIQLLLGKETADYGRISKQLAEAVNRFMWDEDEGLYCDARTSLSDVRSNRDAIIGRLFGERAEKGRQVLDAALKKKAGLAEDEESGWLLNYAWIINTPMEMGFAPKDKADRALERMHGEEFIGPYGMYLSGIFRDSAMTISTGVMAAAQARYGYADRSLELISRMFGAFGMASAGCISEMLPDYGCFVQAWTIYGVMVPVVNYFFGIKPSAAENTIRIRPCMPESWPEAAIEKVKVLDGELSVKYRKEDGKKCYRVSFTGKAQLLFEHEKDGIIDSTLFASEFEIKVD